MTVKGGVEVVNLRTGERFRRVVGNGESVLESLGIPGLRPVEPDALAEYERAMEVAVPEIVAAVRRRGRLAHEARQRWLG
jgi:hypothetical protein